MADGENVRPGSWVGDTVEEFKKLPTWGKIAVGVVVVGVAGFAYYQYRQSQASTTTSTSASGGGLGIPNGATDTSVAGLSDGSIAPGSTGGSTGATTGTGSSTGTTLPVATPPRAPTPVTTTAKPSAPKLSTYTVQRGDNLSSIASKLHVNGGWQALYNANKSAIGSNPNLIYAGTKLQVPK